MLDEPTVAMDVESRRAFWATMRAFAARGKTVVFATHYLDEADAYADRVVLMATGAIVADGPPTEIKAMVGSRTIRATLPGADRAMLAALPGVTDAELHGEAIVLACSDSDAALRALLDASTRRARDIEVTRRRAGGGVPAADRRGPGDGGGMSTTYMRFELLRMFRNRRFFVFSLGFPVVLYYLIAGPNKQRARSGRLGHLGARLLHGRARRLRDDDRGPLGGGPDLGRALDRLEPPAADHPADDARLLPDEGADRLRCGLRDDRRDVRRRRDARRQPPGRATGSR